MRTSDAAMVTAQKNPLHPLVKLQLTEGANDDTYTQTRILSINHVEEEFHQEAEVVLHNRDKALTADYKGYKGFITYGFIDATGSENYSGGKCAPLWVVEAKEKSAPGELLTVLRLVGIPDLMAMDFAEDLNPPEGPYWLDSDSSITVKTLLQGISGASLSPSFTWPTAYTINFDSEDQLIDSFTPADLFTIKLGESRLAKMRELLGYTKSVMRANNNTALHVLVPIHSLETWVADTKYELNDYVQPTTPNNNFTYKATSVSGDQKSHATTEPTWPTTAGGTVVDDQVTWTAVAPQYEYSLASGEHTFFSKEKRTRVVMPNYVVVLSPPSHATKYYGTAEDTEFTGLSDMTKRWTEYARLDSTEEAQYLAKAILQNFKRGASVGAGMVPMTVNLEVHDWIKITDDRRGDTALGNVARIQRVYGAGMFKMHIDFGHLRIDPFYTLSLLAPLVIPPEIQAQIAALQPLIRAQEELFRGIR